MSAMETETYSQGCNVNEDFEEVKEYFDKCSIRERICFVRGYFDTNGVLQKSMQNIKCTVRCTDKVLKEDIKKLINVPCEDDETGLIYFGCNVIEFLHALYKDAEYKDYNYLFAAYRDLLYFWKPSTRVVYKDSSTNKFQYPGDGMLFKYKKTLPDAVAPAKAHITDTGYDLCLVKKVKEENGMIMYDTGIAVQPPVGYYFELVGRSSISKTGYIVANSIGIIDASYTGSLKVALVKVNKEAPDIELPARLVQLIPRQLVHLDAMEVLDLDGTKRAEGGFGSTGTQC